MSVLFLLLDILRMYSKAKPINIFVRFQRFLAQRKVSETRIFSIPIKYRFFQRASGNDTVNLEPIYF